MLKQIKTIQDDDSKQIVGNGQIKCQKSWCRESMMTILREFNSFETNKLSLTLCIGFIFNKPVGCRLTIRLQKPIFEMIYRSLAAEATPHFSFVFIFLLSWLYDTWNNSITSNDLNLYIDWWVYGRKEFKRDFMDWPLRHSRPYILIHNQYSRVRHVRRKIISFSVQAFLPDFRSCLECFQPIFSPFAKQIGMSN